MVLTVPFENFAEAAQRLKLPMHAYLAEHGTGTRATAALPEAGMVLHGMSDLPLKAAKKALEAQGLMCFRGHWSLDGEELEAPRSWVAAVAYKSSETRPGLWVDAFPDEPSTGEVMARMYDEFVDADEIDDIGLERFIQAAEPNVVVLGPDDQQRFRARHERSEPEGDEEPVLVPESE